jgi:hypothetical protein
MKGRDGKTRDELWKDGMSTLYGIAMKGFPK